MHLFRNDENLIMAFWFNRITTTSAASDGALLYGLHPFELVV